MTVVWIDSSEAVTDRELDLRQAERASLSRASRRSGIYRDPIDTGCTGGWKATIKKIRFAVWSSKIFAEAFDDHEPATSDVNGHDLSAPSRADFLS